jgi:PKD repeat protein
MKQLYKIIILFVLVISFNNLNAKSNYLHFGVAKIIVEREVNNLVLPTATISGSTTVCQNATSPQITFTGSGGTAPYIFTYKINNGSDIITSQSIGDVVKLNVPTSTTGNFVYTLVSIKDSTNATQAQTGTITVKVNALPVVGFTFTNDNSCSGTAVQFNSNVSGSGTYTYAWDFGDGFTSTTQNPSHSFISLGCSTAPFTVKLTVTDTSGGCSISTSHTVIVKQKPDINFEDVNNQFNQFSNCLNASSNTSYSITVGNISVSSCITSYSIDWGDGTTENNVSFPKSHNYPQLGVYNMVISASGNGCSNSKTYIVKNISNPSGGILNPGGTTDMCTPTPVIQYTIGNWATNSPGTTYAIDYGDGSTILNLNQDDMIKTSYYNSTTPSASSNYPVPYSYNTSSCPNTNKEFTIKLIVTNACKSTTGTVIGGNTLSKPAANFTAPINACVNTSTLFTNTTISGYGQNCDQSAIYKWNFGDGSPTITTPLSPPQNINHTYTNSGVYTVTLTVQNFCGTATKTQQICIEPALTPPTINLTPANASNCAPLSVNASTPNVVSNCITPIQYLWRVTYTDLDCDILASDPTYLNSTTSASQNPVFNFTTPGNYSIQLQETNSCGMVQSLIQNLIVKKPPVVSINPIANLCGGNSGTTIISPTANVKNCGFTTSELVYNWSFPGGTPATSSLVAPQVTYTTGGSKTVSLFISAVNGCANSVISNQTFAIGIAPTLGTLNPTTQTICSGSATTVLPLTAQSGTTFSWSATTVPAGVNVNPSSGNASSIPALTISNSNNQPKTVTLTIISTLNGCPSINTYDIIVNPAPIITQPIGSTICSGGIVTPLSVLITPTPASGNATYKWYSNTTGDTNIATSTLVNTSTIDGNYTPPSTLGTIYYFCEVTFSSSGSCPNIKSNAVPIIVNAGVTITTQPLATQNNCVGGTISSPLSVIYSGGTGTPSYQWYSTTNNSATGGTPVGTNSATYTPPALTIAQTYNYYVVITYGGSGCGTITSNLAQIVVVNDPTVTIQPLPMQTVCQNSAATVLSVVASGGLGTSYSYQWFSSISNSNTGGGLISGETNNTFTPLTTNVGTLYYYCVITQVTGTGCNATSATAKVTVNLAPAFTTTLTPSTICLGQNPSLITVVTNSDSLSPIYQWYSNTNNLNSGGTLLSGETNATFNPPAIPAGTIYYYCIVTFPSIVGSCSEIISSPVKVIINQNPVIANKSAIICSGNAFTILPVNSGSEIVPVGTTYTWSNPTISPVGSITGASTQMTSQTNISQTLINTTTSSATVTYTITPLSGVCPGLPFTVVVTVNPAISANVTSTNSTCFGANNGAIQINITGGIPFSSGAPYQISWTGPNLFNSAALSISNLAPGDYNLSVMDAGGCPFSKIYKITEPDDISIATDLEKDITCFNDANGEIKITITGGTLNYSYAWTKNGTAYGTTEDLANLSPGIYVVTVSDANNCGPKTATFTITEPPILAVNLVSQTNILCFGQATGTITVNVVGGTSSYTYAWTGPNGFTSSNQNLSNLFAGTYDLVVTDNSGCTKTLNVTLTQPIEIVITAATTPIICYGANDASITLSITGGIAPYNTVWSTLATGLFQDNLSAGDYLITVTDANNCVKTLNVNIPEPPIFTINPVVKQISCFGMNDGSINLNLVGGIAPLTLVWSDGSTAGLTRNNLGPGSYTVTIVDSKPCTISKTFIILEPQELVLTANITHAFDCDDANSGAINLLVAGGTPPFTYSWSNGTTSEDLNNILAGNYLITVIDSRGCSKTAQYVINRQPPIVIGVETKTEFDCETKYVKQTFVAQVSGGVPPYQLTWSSGTVSGVNNETMNTNQNGTVVLGVTDNLGCTANYTFNVVVPKLGTPSFTTSSYAYTTFGTFSISDPIQFTNTATADYSSIAWDFGDGSVSTEENPTHTFVKEGSYVVTQTVTYPFGCIYIHTVTLLVDKGYKLMVPNGFTPNGDGINETFKPVFVGLKSLQLDVYDTWGELIFTEQ